MITQEEWRKEKNDATNIKRSIVGGCAKETKSERESKGDSKDIVKERIRSEREKERKE